MQPQPQTFSSPFCRTVFLLILGLTSALACNQNKSASNDANEAPQDGPIDNSKETEATTTAVHAAAVSTRDKLNEKKHIERQKLCETSCAASASLNCLSVTGCERQCQENFAIPICEKELLQVLKCAANQPTENWVCPSGNSPQLREGTCDAEQQAAMNCMGAK